MDAKRVGKKIKQLRLKEGLTQKQLAKVLNIHLGMLSRYELGNSSISAQLLEKIADYFDISMDELLSRNLIPMVMEKTSGAMVKKCPVYAHIYSSDIYSDKNANEVLYSMQLSEIFSSEGEFFGLKITDESMTMKSFYKGSVAIARKQSVARNGDLVIYSYDDKKASYGVYSEDENRIIISPQSQDAQYKPFFVEDIDKFEIIGKIVMIFGPVK